MYSKRIQKKVKKDYEQIADEFSQSRSQVWEDFDRFLPYYQKNFRVLDLGCGNGRLIHFLTLHKYKEYLGVDQSELLLKYAKSLHPDAQFLRADMTHLPPLKQKFDAIFVIASFHHIPPSLQLQTLQSWKPHLKENGFLFLMNWNLHQIHFWPLWLKSWIIPIYGFRGLLVPWKNKISRYYYAFTKKRLNVLLQKAGFKILENAYVRNGQDAGFFSGKNILTVAQNGNS